MGPRAASIGAIIALCTLQCAKLERIGSTCGNGALDPSREYCEGDLHDNTVEPTRLDWQCGQTCQLVCSKDVPCPSDDWSCTTAGVCVEVAEVFANSLDVVGPAGHVKTVDFDSDGIDDVLVEPVNVSAPYVAHFAITDPTKGRVATTFPADAIALVDRARADLSNAGTNQNGPAVVAQLQNGLEVTMTRASKRADGVITRDLEGLSFVTTDSPPDTISYAASAIDYLYPATDQTSVGLYEWFHGSSVNYGDTFARFDFTSREHTKYFRIPVTDRFGQSLKEHRIVIAIPSDKKIPCLRLAIFTRDATSAMSGLLQIVRPELKSCDWSKGWVADTISGSRYPAARGPSAVFVADLNGDGANDLVVNARTSDDKLEPLVLRGPLVGGQLVPLTDSVGGDLAIVAAGKARGQSRQAILGCLHHAVADPESPCLAGTAGPSAELRVLLPGAQETSPYAMSESIYLHAQTAGFSDLNGDGYDDVWAWSPGSTGPRIFENTPSGFFATSGHEVDHTSSALVAVASGSLRGSLFRDLVALTESRGPANDGKVEVESEVRVTRGDPTIDKMTAQFVTRVSGIGRAVMTVHDPISKTGTALIPVVTCRASDSNTCSAASDSREPSRLDVTVLRPLGSEWFAAPSFLGCGTNPFAAPSEAENPYPRARNSVGAVEFPLGASAAEHDTQVLTVAAAASFGAFGLGGWVRWGKLRVGTLTNYIPCTLIGDLIESVAVAPAFAGVTTPWLMIGTTQQSASSGLNVAYVLTPGLTPTATSIIRESPLDDGYRAIYAEHHDVDGDGDNDFVVLERKNGLEGQRTSGRPVVYMNEPCKDNPDVRCLFVKLIDVQVKQLNGVVVHSYADASGEGFAWQRSHIDEARDPNWREWWFATVRNVGVNQDKLVTQRIRAVGTDRNVTFEPTSEKGEVEPPQIGATRQELAWGDFDGDQVLDLLYVTDHGSRLYQRGVQHVASAPR